ncbi:hypothetical protein [Phytohabitans houttuyneae]|nr:hypothetical protein [Phytohabitans houttuyneae]
MRPYVVAHVAVSVEGATDGFAPDLAQFYGLAATWSEDVTLVGADTILAQEPALAATPDRVRRPEARCSPSWTPRRGYSSGPPSATPATGRACSPCTPRRLPHAQPAPT